MFLWQKICFYCGSKSTIKRGHLNGAQRWYCKSCKRAYVRHKRLTNDMVNTRYSKGNLTVNDLSEEYGVSMRTIYRKLTKSYKEELLAISKILCHTDKDPFIGALEEWHTKWEDFLKERTTTEDGKEDGTF